jgi:hypothetical protein
MTSSKDKDSATHNAFVDGCVRFARQIDLAAGFRAYLPDRFHLDAALECAVRVFGDEDRRVSSLLDRIGIGLQSAGELKPARRHLERALASAVRNLGDDHPCVATSRSNLAGVLQDLESSRARKSSSSKHSTRASVTSVLFVPQSHAQSHGALTYYYDHPEEIEGDISDGKRVEAEIERDRTLDPKSRSSR